MDNEKKQFVDVLFINGCDYSVPHPPRYRVTHQREQLEANNISTDEVFYTELTTDYVRFANMFIIFRCPWTPVVGEFIELAHQQNKKVIFDIDDLIIDTVYTDLVTYVKNLDETEKSNYDGYVKSINRTLRLCDGAITTTSALGNELGKYVDDVFVNRNTASDEMYGLSLKALLEKERNYSEDVDLGDGVIVPRREEGEVRIGYFSGSITHNSDVELILEALGHIMEAYSQVRLYIVGELDLPAELKKYKNRIVAFPFMDWRKLPYLISMVDINLAPLEDNIFNLAKSENKWVEAALVKVVTCASNLGAFKEMVDDGKTGVLCNEDEWERKLRELIENPKKRKNIAEKAFGFAKKNCLTLYSGRGIAEYIKKISKKSVLLILPSTGISGGIMVALRHAIFLSETGYSITILADKPTMTYMGIDSYSFPVIAWNENQVKAHFGKGIATFWKTTDFLQEYNRIEDKYYLVQNYETDFYEPGDYNRVLANKTYFLEDDIKYITISRWCQDWLLKDYNKKSKYARNGIVRKEFNKVERKFDEKIRVLIEGDSTVAYKGVDESFRIANKLDRDKYEIWFLSYNDKVKDWYKVDKFFNRIPYCEVEKLYGACHILLKSSWLESFSYPPLEMMATDGFVVALQNGGNKEYMKDEYNCLIYERGNYEDAVNKIERIVEDKSLRDKLLSNYKDTVEVRDWDNLREEILRLYDL